MNYIRKTREVAHNKWIVVRNCIQLSEAYAIFNFYEEQAYRKFLTDIDNFKSLSYFKQELRSNDQSYPSIFIVPADQEFQDHNKLKGMMLQAMKHYDLDSIILGTTKGAVVVYKNGSHHLQGDSVFASTDPKVFLTDCYKIDDYYYTIL